MDVSTCSRCRQTLPASSFAKRSSAATGLQAYCKICQSEIGKIRVKHPRADPTTMKHCSKCSRHLTALSFPDNPACTDGLGSWCRECIRLRRVERQYNITADEYREMAKDGCQIRGCGSFENLHVDHDHACCPKRSISCGKCVRGVICSSHNTALGLFNDDPESLLAAAEYLRS